MCLHLLLSLTLISQFIGNMSKGRTSGYTPASSTRTAAPTIWWILHCISRQRGVAVANSLLRHGRPPDGRCGVKTSHQLASAFWPLRGVPVEATIERSIIQMLTGALLLVQCENSCPCLYWSVSAATNLRRYIVEVVVYLLLCWSPLAGLGNHDENPCPGRFWPDLARR